MFSNYPPCQILSFNFKELSDYFTRELLIRLSTITLFKDVRVPNNAGSRVYVTFDFADI